MKGRTWVVGDIHGCAEALARLLAELELGPDDRFLAAGDLFHRGPDPLGVLEQLEALGPRFAMVRGNHETALQARVARLGGELSDLRGDRQARMAPMSQRAARRLMAFLDGRPDFLEGQRPDGQSWFLVHASLLPGAHPRDLSPHQLQHLAHCDALPGRPLWVEAWAGPALVVFGHARFLAGPHGKQEGRVVAWGVDTGCVEGGALTALCLEDLSTRAVAATAPAP